jgi:two-component sensor histidine kinase
VAVAIRGEAQGLMRMSVHDNGSGLPVGFDWRRAPSLGLRLVQMLAGQLHATFEVSSDGRAEFAVTVVDPNL